MTLEPSQNSPADPSPPPSPSSRAPSLVLLNSGKTVDHASKKKYVKQVTGSHNDTELDLAAQPGGLSAVRQFPNDIDSQIVGTWSCAELDERKRSNKEQETALDIAEEPPHSKELSQNLRECLNHNATLVNKAAVLIAQIAFAAIFTIPGSPVETSHHISVQVLVIFNSIAFFASLAVVVIQMTRSPGELKPKVIVVMAKVTNMLIWLASACISVVFMAAITIVVGRQCQVANILIMVVGGALIAGSLGIKAYYEVRRLRTIE
ncbi:hypothetical protein CDL15_Pgr022659 [Punica granatum]|nr:hypothetical protein CDL15_Pgr022659 [Punica granatum]